MPGSAHFTFRSGCGLFAWVAALAVVVAACGGQTGSGHRAISSGAALSRLYAAIDSGRGWATAQDVAAARANIHYAPGSNARCGPDYGDSGPELERFVCYLRYVDDGGQPQRIWFSENRNGSRVVPMSPAQFRVFAAHAVAYERSHLPATRPSVMAWLRGGTIARRIRTSANAQPRVSGTACDGSYGVQDATPAVSVVTSGNYLIAGPGTSCDVAQVVATALGDSPKPATAVLSVPDQTTGGRLRLRCRALSRIGPVRCAAPRGAVVYVGADDPPTTPGTG